MKIAGRRAHLEKMESVVMTDIILNMFIFFFISFSLLYTFSPYRIKKLEVKLPQANSARPLEGKGQVNITINNEGVIYLDQEHVSKKALREKVAQQYTQNPGLAVILSSDRLVRFKDIVDVLDILNAVGIKNLNIAATGEK
ncbi:MAG: Biopolymer transport protein ExbD/TolR [Candidatus Omnitrophica bacterium ADurb.Bin205]|nr:MAG: Biopolymer transport protein ExbD/TolR [Candidatus Omnitrophica bacterium ADurb.Bin205]